MTSKLFYSLEDYFDVLARERTGIPGRVSKLLGDLFALSGDMLKLSVLHRRPR